MAVLGATMICLFSPCSPSYSPARMAGIIIKINFAESFSESLTIVNDFEPLCGRSPSVAIGVSHLSGIDDPSSYTLVLLTHVNLILAPVMY